MIITIIIAIIVAVITILSLRYKKHKPQPATKEGLLNVPGDFCFNLQIPFKQIYKMFRAYGKLPKEATMQVFSKGYPDGTVKDHFRLYDDDDEFIGIGMMDLNIMKHYEKMDETLHK